MIISSAGSIQHCRAGNYIYKKEPVPISSESKFDPQALLVTIQSLGDKPPVFFFPGLGMPVSSLFNLTDRLGKEHPLFGLKGVESISSPRSEISIEEFAKQYICAINPIKAQGPLTFAGHSYGGHLALETARKLSIPGEPEPLVVIIDTYPPLHYRVIPFFMRIQLYFANYKLLDHAKKVAGYFTWKYFRRNSQHIAHSIQKQLGGRSKTSYAAAYSAFNNYKPKPYPGRVVLFKASHREWEEENYIMEAWKKYIIGDLEVRIIPGDHLNLIKDPSAIELASQLKEILRNSGIRP